MFELFEYNEIFSLCIYLRLLLLFPMWRLNISFVVSSFVRNFAQKIMVDFQCAVKAFWGKTWIETHFHTHLTQK